MYCVCRNILNMCMWFALNCYRIVLIYKIGFQAQVEGRWDLTGKEKKRDNFWRMKVFLESKQETEVWNERRRELIRRVRKSILGRLPKNGEGQLPWTWVSRPSKALRRAPFGNPRTVGELRGHLTLTWSKTFFKSPRIHCHPYFPLASGGGLICIKHVSYVLPSRSDTYLGCKIWLSLPSHRISWSYGKGDST